MLSDLAARPENILARHESRTRHIQIYLGLTLSGLAWDLWDCSHKVASGQIEDATFAPIIIAAPADMDWRDEAGWRAANPAIEAGFCSIDELRIKARRIEHFPAEIADFKRFHLNHWQDAAANPWLPLEFYDACEAIAPPEDLAVRVGLALIYRASKT